MCETLENAHESVAHEKDQSASILEVGMSQGENPVALKDLVRAFVPGRDPVCDAKLDEHADATVVTCGNGRILELLEKRWFIRFTNDQRRDRRSLEA
jgi:hypothetical protein